MPFEITKPRSSFSIVKAQTQAELSRFARSREIAKIQREGAKHIAAQRVHELKTRFGIDLMTQLQHHAFVTADEFVQDVMRILQDGNRSPEAQMYIEQIAGELLGNYRGYLSGILDVGITNIAQEISRSVEPTTEERRWFS